MNTVTKFNKEIAQIIEILNQEIKNPLTSILFNIQTIKRMLNNDEEFSIEVIKEKIHLIEIKASTIGQVLEQLIDLVRAQITGIQIKKNLTNTHDIISDAILKSKELSQEKQVMIEHQTTDSFCTVACDKDRIVQVVSDLISNLISFNNKSKKVKLTTNITGQNAQFKIIDEDCTVDKSYLSNLFEKFWQSGVKNKEKISLGLAVAKSIIEAHHGRIWAESKKGLGTAFFIELPKTELSDLKAGMAL